MKSNSLAPHTFITTDEQHQRHPAWLHRFSAVERHELIKVDLQARSNVATIFIAALTWALVINSVVLALVL